LEANLCLANHFSAVY